MLNNINMQLSFDDKDIETFRQLIEQEFGLTLSTHSKETIVRKIMPRINALKLGSLREYLDFMTWHPQARTELYNLPGYIMNTESYFLREYSQLELFIDLLKKQKKEGAREESRGLSIISAGCSEGQEPYSIAMLIKRIKDKASTKNIRIYGIDINVSAIRKAQAGIYSDYSFRSSNTPAIREYFEEAGTEGYYPSAEKFRIKPEIINSVEFIHANILHPITFKGLKHIDFIFCRNVLMYMSEKAASKIVFNFWEALSENGYLFIGQSESLRKHEELFEPESHQDVVVYKKRRG